MQSRLRTPGPVACVSNTWPMAYNNPKGASSGIVMSSEPLSLDLGLGHLCQANKPRSELTGSRGSCLRLCGCSAVSWAPHRSSKRSMRWWHATRRWWACTMTSCSRRRRARRRSSVPRRGWHATWKRRMMRSYNTTMSWRACRCASTVRAVMSSSGWAALWSGGFWAYWVNEWGMDMHTCCVHVSPSSAPQESRWAHIQNTAAKKTLLLGTIKMATLNLFQTVSKQLKESSLVSLEDTHKQLDMVRGGSGIWWAVFTEPQGFLIGWVGEQIGYSHGSQMLMGLALPRVWEALLGPTQSLWLSRSAVRTLEFPFLTSGGDGAGLGSTFWETLH